jgi:hypothetical protein
VDGFVTRPTWVAVLADTRLTLHALVHIPHPLKNAAVNQDARRASAVDPGHLVTRIVPADLEPATLALKRPVHDGRPRERPVPADAVGLALPLGEAHPTHHGPLNRVRRHEQPIDSVWGEPHIGVDPPQVVGVAREEVDHATVAGRRQVAGGAAAGDETAPPDPASVAGVMAEQLHERVEERIVQAVFVDIGHGHRQVRIGLRLLDPNSVRHHGPLRMVLDG